MEKIWLKNYPREVNAEIDLSQFSSLAHLVESSCSRFKDKPAYYNLGKTLTFGEIDKLSTDFASYLQNGIGLKKGDRLAIQMPNLLQYPVILMGAIKAGVVIVNTNPLYTSREMLHQFNDSGVTAVVILANYASLLQEVLPKTQIKHVIVTEIGDLLGFPKKLVVNFVIKKVKKMVPGYDLPNAVSFNHALIVGAQKTLNKVSTSQDDIAFLQYTGGTTGVSKGAVLTHKNVLANTLQIYELMKPILKEDEAVVTALPLYHIFSLTVNCFAFMNYGAANILITNPRDIPAFIKDLQKNKFTVITGVNTLYNALMNHPDFTKIDFSNLKISVAGAMALQSSVAHRWKQLTNTAILEGYGLTESSPVVACNPTNGKEKQGTIGLPLASTDVKLIDDDGKELGLNEPGELCVKGPQVMQGYWQQPEETKKVLSPDGWLKTGDVAVMDTDGFLKIVDRKKDMILVSGFNVYPNEIEDVIAAHPDVLEVAAVGVPDAHSGESIKVVIVKKNPSLTAEEVIAFARKSLTGYKIPKHVEFRTELPKTNVGKILRRALR